MDVVLLRPPLVYGPGVRANFLRLLKSVERGYPLPLAKVDNNRSFIYIGNLADALHQCLYRPEAAGKTFLLSDGEDISTPELIRAVAYYLGQEAHLVPVPQGLLRLIGGISGAASINRLIDSLEIDSRYIRDTLAWAPPYTLMEGLEDTVRWYQQKQLPLAAYSEEKEQRYMDMYFHEMFSKKISI
jgi:nucleoside-diphosphate-sugar epimerase